MCIRDRVYTIHCFKLYSFSLIYVLFHYCTPVSYTHLDVYKRQTRWSLVLQEYDLNWEYIPGKKNIVADTLSRVNIKEQTYEGEKETIIKIYHIIKSRTNLANIIKELERQQEQDPKLNKIRQRLTDKDDHIPQYYCKHQGILFIKPQNKFITCKLAIPQAAEKA